MLASGWRWTRMPSWFLDGRTAAIVTTRDSVNDLESCLANRIQLTTVWNRALRPDENVRRQFQRERRGPLLSSGVCWVPEETEDWRTRT
jgi:hypothetical protein